MSKSHFHPHWPVWYASTLLFTPALPHHCLSQSQTHYHLGPVQTSSTQQPMHPTSSQRRARLHTAAWRRQENDRESGEEGQ